MCCKEAKSNVICLMGPTAVGKSTLAIALAHHLPFSIISVDSTLVYRGMDIGTAKPSQSELIETPHRLINIRDPAESYSVGEFIQDAQHAIKMMLASGKTPLLVGGTMLYFYSLQRGLSPTLPSTDPKIRAQLQADLKNSGIEKLYQRLSGVDPNTAAIIHPNDTQRILRALEVYDATGKRLSDHHTASAQKNCYNFINLVILPWDRKQLHQRLADRFMNMLEAGFVEEVARLKRRKDIHSDLPSIRAVGYRQAWQYLENKLSYEEFCQKGMVATRQLVKRQLTWLRRWQNVHYFYQNSENLFEKTIAFLKKTI